MIKAETKPSKIVPAAQSKDPKSGKLIYDRVNSSGQSEKIVSREEQPVDIKDKPVGAVLPQAQSGASGGAMRQSALGSGVVGVEPKKIHTIAIRPNQVAGAASVQPPAADAAPMPAPAPVHAQPAAPPKPQRAAAAPAPRPVAQTQAPARRVAAAPPSNAPLSLSPNASAPARTAQNNVRTAAVAPPTRIAPTRSVAPARAAPARTVAPARIAPAASGGGYAVQIASRHNEADAKVSFHSLQSKFPQQLGGRQPLIRRVDLGAKGIYYRAMVGPFGSAEEASKLCSSLKAAGGQCLIQKI